MKIDLTTDRGFVVENPAGVRFLALGKLPERPKDPARFRRALRRRRDKILRRRRSSAEEVWGTLGMADNSPPAWTGQLACSEAGNLRSLPEESEPVTCEEIGLIKQTFPESAADGRRIRERYISLEQVELPVFPDRFRDEDVPRLRLTVMLDPDEGAEVYVQLYPVGGRSHDEVDLEYIQPRPTERHDCSVRDRLTYLIPILPRRRIEEDDEGGWFRLASRRHAERFVIKILTFRRRNSESETIVGRAFYHLWSHTHQLVGWQAGEGRFRPIDGSAVRPDVRTLFLIHGTLSHTEQAFAGLLEGGTASWVAERYGPGPRQYGQIIGFDHPTFSEDAADDARALMERLGPGFRFGAGLDLVTHSRGGLLAKHLMLHTGAFPARRAALAACANGVGYLTAGHRISKLLSVLRAGARGSQPILGSILALAQHSGEFLLGLPGSRLMTPGSDRLAAVLKPLPQPTRPILLPVVGNYTADLSRDRRFFRRWAERGLDLLLKAFLGRQHDWVVGTREQYIMDPECYPAGWNPERSAKRHIHAARHSDYFHADRTQAPERVRKFLERGVSW